MKRRLSLISGFQMSSSEKNDYNILREFLSDKSIKLILNEFKNILKDIEHEILNNPQLIDYMKRDYFYNFAKIIRENLLKIKKE